MATPPLPLDPATSQGSAFSCFLVSALFHCMCMNALPEYMSMQYTHGWYPQSPKKGVDLRKLELQLKSVTWVLGNEPVLWLSSQCS